MHLRAVLVLGLLLGAEASKVVRRQNSPTSDAAASTDDAEPTSTEDEPETTSVVVSKTTKKDDEPTTTEDEPEETTTEEGDSTVTRTTTVTDKNAKTISTTITKMITSIRVITETSTEVETVTVTGTNSEVETEVVLTTSTNWIEKRAIDFAPRTLEPEYDPEIIPTPYVTATTSIDNAMLEHAQGRHHHYDLHKRAVITKIVTVTVGDDSEETVTNTITKTVVSTTSTETVTTSKFTKTVNPDATSTTTSTSTVTVNKTRINTAVETVEQTSTDGGAAETGGASSGDDSNSDKGTSGGGLSTGAKAGIGAGCGVAGLLILGGILGFCLKRYKSRPKYEDDDMFGSSEVPVGGPVSGSAASRYSRPMSELQPTVPNVGPVAASSPQNEGYRGTALGDGRSGFAKPAPFGAAYTPYTPVSADTTYSRSASGGGDHGSPSMGSVGTAVELGPDNGNSRWAPAHPAEMDNYTRGSSPPNVYEMGNSGGAGGYRS